MAEQVEKNLKKRIVLGLLAHVDAGKTTLSEGLLYLSGQIKKVGRVDHGDCFLDTHALERARGITIFSKQARFSLGDTEITLLDTPGHVDFSTETERTLSVLDYAVLVISGTDGVQAHTETLWRLLRKYHIPTFFFISKCDLAHADGDRTLAELKDRLSSACIDLSKGFDPEEIALCDEALLERYFRTDTVTDSDIAVLIREEKLFPCYFGSGLKLEGIEPLLYALEHYTTMPSYAEDFGAMVYKIDRDEKGNRLTYMKITGGTLKVRMPVSYHSSHTREEITEKVSQLRLYAGEKYSTADEVYPGTVCAVLGFSETAPGMGLGAAANGVPPLLEAVLNYRVVLPEDIDPAGFLPKLRLLEEEDPALHVVWQESLGEIHLRLMGEVQIDVIKNLIAERFGISVDIADGRILYKETIKEPVVGIGHFEPLRHYAEVHLLLEPLAPGSGIVFDSKCSEDLLDRNWQRLILGQLASHELIGVLTGSPLTDLRITLVAGRAHLKHTEGGDFRQAAIRALRHGLMQAESVLLEPYYHFALELPGEYLGRGIHDIQAMNGTFGAPEEIGERMLLKGTAPVAAMANYQTEVLAYTHGKGRLRREICGYAPCKNAAAIIETAGYDPEHDPENPAFSVFCAHGGGFNVPWQEVREYAHVDSGVKTTPDAMPTLPNPKVFARNLNIDDKELEAIMEREFGPIKRRQYKKPVADDRFHSGKKVEIKKDYLIVDGYNMIFSWEGLKALAETNDMDLARHRLIELLSHYQAFVRCELVCVFDGYKIKGNPGDHQTVDGIHVVYTKEGETADRYIETLLKEIGSHYNVRIATSDALIQLSAVSSGVLRMTAGELEEEISAVQKKLALLVEELNRKNEKLKNRLDLTEKNEGR